VQGVRTGADNARRRLEGACMVSSDPKVRDAFTEWKVLAGMLEDLHVDQEPTNDD
jgi:hypothetical protein